MFRLHKGGKGAFLCLLGAGLIFSSSSCVSLPKQRLLSTAPPEPVVAPPPPSSESGAAQALQALQEGNFEVASQQAARALQQDQGDPHALLVRAITRYKSTAQRLSTDGRAAIFQKLDRGDLDQRTLDMTLGQAEAQLALVDDDLAQLATHKGLSVELCLACWQIDWNGNGRVDRRDHLLMQIELDADGKEIPEGDPRRTPTFRFDHGDVLWAQAFVSFQRAALDLALAYDWGSAAQRLEGRGRERPSKITVRLSHPERVAAARAQILRGLGFSDASRVAYLAETDDDREWVPSPRQRSHPMPLPVDDRLYATWEAVVGDARRLLQGDEALSVAELLALGDTRWEGPPGASINVGRMLSNPRDLVIDLEAIDALRRDRAPSRSQMLERVAAGLLGAGYTSGGKTSPLPGRLSRMQREIAQGEEPLERKLRYLFWIN